jgi:hypothetical protein
VFRNLLMKLHPILVWGSAFLSKACTKYFRRIKHV